MTTAQSGTERRWHRTVLVHLARRLWLGDTDIRGVVCVCVRVGKGNGLGCFALGLTSGSGWEGNSRFELQIEVVYLEKVGNGMDAMWLAWRSFDCAEATLCSVLF